MTLDPHAEHVAALPTICDQRDAGCCGTPACLNAGVWTDDPYDEPLGVFEGTRWHSHSEPICADPECVTYLTRSQMATMRDLLADERARALREAAAGGDIGPTEGDAS